MNFADEWDSIFPGCAVETRAPARAINNADFDKEFEEFCKEQKRIKAERLANEAEEKKTMSVPAVSFTEVEAQPTEAVAEEAYQAFVEEAEKPKSKRKKKTEAVVEETSDETPVVED